MQEMTPKEKQDIIQLLVLGDIQLWKILSRDQRSTQNIEKVDKNKKKSVVRTSQKGICEKAKSELAIKKVLILQTEGKDTKY